MVVNVDTVVILLSSGLHFHMPTETSILTCIQSPKAQNLSGRLIPPSQGAPSSGPKKALGPQGKKDQLGLPTSDVPSHAL